MGSRGRSIRLRINFLVSIPLIMMLGLFGYAAYTSVTKWLNLDRAPSLIQATVEPLSNFVSMLQAERRAAVVYLSRPSAASLTIFENAVTTTKGSAQTLSVALNSPATRHSTSQEETAAIARMTTQINHMTQLRTEVVGKKLAPLDALTAYANIIAGRDAVLQAEAKSTMDAGPVPQSFGLISAVDTQEDMSEQDAVLASALASGSLTQADRVAFSQATGRQQKDTTTYQELLTPAELATYQATLNRMAPKSVQDNLSTVQQAVPAGIPLSLMQARGLNSQNWQALTQAWLTASSKAGTDAAGTVLAANEKPARNARTRVLVIGAVGAAGLILTLMVSLLLSRSINRRLSVLRRSALALANEQLPAVVTRLRRGESVDVAAEAPPLRAGSDEIGQVGEAIDTVRQTAIGSAIEEARARQSVNGMFRNLARRNQSLLQRQLSVLDTMERRATDPDVLEDLFKLDHLTTRMRRHAEGLIILSGAAPGRSWSAPVKLIDVMRGAVAEVEEYARVTVSTQSRAALSGSAVTDVIHLLAELIENATTLSPPYTQVRVGGELVANGFAIEIEDRGLGMTPERLGELNERLATPPDISPANTEQLGLFVVSQLARRHGISVTLRPSRYGGTMAVALIPRQLMVEEGPTPLGRGTGPLPSATAYTGYAPRTEDGGAVRLPATPGAGGNWPGPGGTGDWAAVPGPVGVPGANGGSGAYPPAPAQPTAPGYGGMGTGSYPAGADGGSPEEAGARRGGWQDQRPDPRQAPGEVPVVTGVPVSRPTAVPLSAFDAFTPIRREGADGGPAAQPTAHPQPNSDPQSYPGSPRPRYARPGYDRSGTAATQAYTYRDTGGGSGGGTDDQGISERGEGGHQDGTADGEGDHKGLPRRVRQASLAPQLRSSATAAVTGNAGGVPPADAASLAVMRNTLSAMQHGWQQGRTAAEADAEREEQ
jgi:signal transduction histidine kinase